MSGSGPDTLSDVRKVLPNARRYFPDVRELVGRPSRMSGSGRQALPYVQEWWKVPPECPGVVARPSRMSGCGRIALPDVPQWSGWPSRMFGSGQEALPDVQELS